MSGYACSGCDFGSGAFGSTWEVEASSGKGFDQQVELITTFFNDHNI